MNRKTVRLAKLASVIDGGQSDSFIGSVLEVKCGLRYAHPVADKCETQLFGELLFDIFDFCVDLLIIRNSTGYMQFVKAQFYDCGAIP